MNTNKSIFISQQFLAIQLGGVFDPEKRKHLESTYSDLTYLPTPSTVYSKELVESYSKNNKIYNYTNGSLFKTSKRSRFIFIDNSGSDSVDTIDNSIEVPDFICNILNKGLSRFSKFKACDDSFLSSERLYLVPNEHPWADFIASLSSENFINLAKFNSA
jgi:hypothetical protein